MDIKFGFEIKIKKLPLMRHCDNPFIIKKNDINQRHAQYIYIGTYQNLF